MSVVAGIDCGTGFTKAVVMRFEPGVKPAILSKGRTRSGVNADGAASSALNQALQQAGIGNSDIQYVASTGFGRYGVTFRDIQVTEITTAARGAFFLVPETQCVLDIGGQTTRAIAVGPRGKVMLFKSNDKCAAGSGMFISRAAKYLEVPLDQVGELSLRALHSHPISSICAVLAESEIINHVSSGVSVEDILRGIHDSLADRAGSLLKRVGLKNELTLIGGVARQRGIVRSIEERLRVKVQVPQDCDFACAIGAALLGMQRLAARN